MAALLLYINNARALQRERIFRDRTNPLDSYGDKRMHKYYRFTRNGVMRIIDILSPSLEPNTNRSHSIPADLQVFIALRFYATGCFYSSTAAHHGISEASVCRIVHRVTEVLVGKKDEYVTWPAGEKVLHNQQDFFDLCGFPGVVGAVDCTHVPLDCAPLGPHEYVFINRKGIHSINVQLICDTDYSILNVVANWPGSVHDSRILTRSEISQRFVRGEVDGVLLGDSGYPQLPWLMTPFPKPATAAQKAFNR